jgi:hypothetical protein
VGLFDPIFEDPRWDQALKDPEKLRKAEDRLWEVYAEQPAQAAYLEKAGEEERKALRQQFTRELPKRYPKAYYRHTPPPAEEFPLDIRPATPEAVRNLMNPGGRYDTMAEQMPVDLDVEVGLRNPPKQPGFEPRDPRNVPALPPQVVAELPLSREAWLDPDQRAREMRRYAGRQEALDQVAQARAEAKSAPGLFLDRLYAGSLPGKAAHALAQPWLEDTDLRSLAKRAAERGYGTPDTAVGRFFIEGLAPLAGDLPVFMAGAKLPAYVLLPAIEFAGQSADLASGGEIHPKEILHAAAMGTILRVGPVPKFARELQGGVVERVGRMAGGTATKAAEVTALEPMFGGEMTPESFLTTFATFLVMEGGRYARQGVGAGRLNTELQRYGLSKREAAYFANNTAAGPEFLSDWLMRRRYVDFRGPDGRVQTVDRVAEWAKSYMDAKRRAENPKEYAEEAAKTAYADPAERAKPVFEPVDLPAGRTPARLRGGAQRGALPEGRPPLEVPEQITSVAALREMIPRDAVGRADASRLPEGFAAQAAAAMQDTSRREIMGEIRRIRRSMFATEDEGVLKILQEVAEQKPYVPTFQELTRPPYQGTKGREPLLALAAELGIKVPDPAAPIDELRSQISGQKKPHGGFGASGPEDVFASAMPVTNAIRELGGIGRDPKLREELSRVPKEVFSRGAVQIDKKVQELNDLYGFDFQDHFELIDALAVEEHRRRTGQTKRKAGADPNTNAYWEGYEEYLEAQLAARAQKAAEAPAALQEAYEADVEALLQGLAELPDDAVGMEVRHEEFVHDLIMELDVDVQPVPVAALEEGDILWYAGRRVATRKTGEDTAELVDVEMGERIGTAAGTIQVPGGIDGVVPKLMDLPDYRAFKEGGGDVGQEAVEPAGDRGDEGAQGEGLRSLRETGDEAPAGGAGAGEAGAGAAARGFVNPLTGQTELFGQEEGGFALVGEKGRDFERDLREKEAAERAREEAEARQGDLFAAEIARKKGAEIPEGEEYPFEAPPLERVQQRLAEARQELIEERRDYREAEERYLQATDTAERERAHADMLYNQEGVEKALAEVQAATEEWERLHSPGGGPGQVREGGVEGGDVPRAQAGQGEVDAATAAAARLPVYNAEYHARLSARAQALVEPRQWNVPYRGHETGRDYRLRDVIHTLDAIRTGPHLDYIDSREAQAETRESLENMAKRMARDMGYGEPIVTLGEAEAVIELIEAYDRGEDVDFTKTPRAPGGPPPKPTGRFPPPPPKPPPAQQGELELGMVRERGQGGYGMAAGGSGREEPLWGGPDRQGTPPEQRAALGEAVGQHMLELPAMVWLYRQMNEGKFPQVRRKLDRYGFFRAAVGDAPGVEKTATIALGADIFDVLTPFEKADLRRIAAYRAAEANPDDPAAAKANAEELYQEMAKMLREELKEQRTPAFAGMVLAHEIGHMVDWLPQHIIKGRGNIFGRIGSLRGYLKHSMAELPDTGDDALSPKERREIRKEAQDTVGPKPPKDEEADLLEWRGAVRVAYQEMLEEAAEARGIVTKRRIVDELREAIAWWQGLLPREDTHRTVAPSGMKMYTGKEPIGKYFEQAHEMYAEAISMLLNNPQELQRRAPSFWKMWFGYLDRKPMVKREYEKVQELLRTGAMLNEVRADMRAGWREADARSVRQEQVYRQMKGSELLDLIWQAADRKFAPAHRRINRAKDLESGGRLKARIGDYLYHKGMHKLYLSRWGSEVIEPMTAAGVETAAWNEYLFHQHVVQNRWNIANPHGFNAKSSAQALEAMKRELGPKRWAALEAADAARWKVRQEDVLALLAEAKVFSPELMEELEVRSHYSPVAASKPTEEDELSMLLRGRFGSTVGPMIYKQIGYLGDTQSPMLATVRKDLGLITLAHTTELKRELGTFLAESGEPLYRPVEMSWDGKRQAPRVIQNERIGTVLYLDEGKLTGFYAPRAVWEMLNTQDPPALRALITPARMAVGAMKALWTGLNYGFWPFNYARDTKAWVKRLPDTYSRMWGTNAYRHYRKQARAAALSLTRGNPNADAREALRRDMLIVVPEQWELSKDYEAFARIVKRYRIDPALFGIDTGKGWDKAVGDFFRRYAAIGQALEWEMKIAGMLHLDRTQPDMPEAQKREIVRERAGSPDFLQHGTANWLIDAVWPFYNPAKQGWRSAWHAWRESPGKQLLMALKYSVLPKLLMAAAGAGGLAAVLGRRRAEDIQEMYKSIPTYDQTNYDAIPLAWVGDPEQRKVLYFRGVEEEEERVIGGILFEILNGDLNPMTPVRFGAGQLPGVNPMAEVAGAWWTYLAEDRNPHDAWRGRSVIPQSEFEAGEGTGAMLKWSANQLGAGIIGRFHTESPDDPDTAVERVLRLPIISNSLGRFFKVSNRGLYEIPRPAVEAYRKTRAQDRLAATEAVVNLLDPSIPMEESLRTLMESPYRVQYGSTKGREIEARRTSPAVRMMLQAQDAQEREIIYRELEAAGVVDPPRQR